MSVMEFVLVAQAIIIGLAIAELLRGFADLLRADDVRISYRSLALSAWALLILLQLWWAIWVLSDRETWTFPQFIVFLCPVIMLYVLARLCFPQRLAGADLLAYFERTARVQFALVALVYASFALLMQPLVLGYIAPPAFASQLGLAALALLALWVRRPAYHGIVIAIMIAQVVWRGLSNVVSQ